MRPANFVWLLWLSSVPSLLAASCESGDDDAPKSLTEACDACLAREACSAPWERCIADDDCKQFVGGVLRADCYSRPPESDCVERAGCELETDSAESQSASDDFETCARTECADTCGFATP